MARVGLRLAAIFLVLLCPALFPSGAFSECFAPSPPERFFLSPSYIYSNPNVIKSFFADIYVYPFASTLEGMNASLSLCDQNCFREAVPLAHREELLAAYQPLSTLNSSLPAAQEHKEEALSLLYTSKQATSSLVSFAILNSVAHFPIFFVPDFPTLMKLNSFFEYATSFEYHYTSSLSSYMGAYDSSSRSAYELAKKIDEKMELLRKAGADDPYYSGKAKATYSSAQSLLAQSGFCKSEASSAISDYFSTRPTLPDFQPIALNEHFQTIGGTQGDSSILSLIKLYLHLSDAQGQMHAEQKTALQSAQGTADSLELVLQTLQSEQLGLIAQDTYYGTTYSGTISTGTSFSGLQDGLKEASQSLQEIKLLLSRSKQKASSSWMENYLSSSIADAQAAEEKANSSLSSLGSVRLNAEGAVLSEMQMAKSALEAAQRKYDQATSSASDAKAKSLALEKLQEASSEFTIAEKQGTSGGRFSHYQKAYHAALASISLAAGKSYAPQKDAAIQELSSLRSLLSKAKKDRLEVDYWEEKAQEYEKLARLATDPYTVDAIEQAAKQQRKEILLSLQEKYSGLEGQIDALTPLALQIRAYKPAFLSPQFDSVRALLTNGKLDVEKSAGSLLSAHESLLSMEASVQSALPQFFEQLLADQSEVYEQYSPPTLGQAGNYRAVVVVKNPTGMGSPASTSLSIPTSAPIYSADLVAGEGLIDAFFDEGKTKLVIRPIPAYSSRSFTFESKQSLSQVSGSEDTCLSADSSSASLSREVQFFASKPLPALLISEELPANTRKATAKFSGKTSVLPIYGQVAEGRIVSVPAGKNSMQVNYEVSPPMDISHSPYSFEQAARGAKKVSYEIEATPSISCKELTTFLTEPYSEISDFSVTAEGSAKITKKSQSASLGQTHLQFSFSPVVGGQKQKFLISFTTQNTSEALASALLEAQLQVQRYNLPSTYLERARQLASQNKPEEALSELALLQRQMDKLGLEGPDFDSYLQKKQEAESELSLASSAVEKLGSLSLGKEAAALSSISQALWAALLSSQELSGSQGASKALSAISKALLDYRSSLSELAYRSFSQAADEYAKSPQPSQASQLLSDSGRLYSQSDPLSSYLASSQAKALIRQGQEQGAQEGQNASKQSEELRQKYREAKPQLEATLSSYSSQYSALSTQGKKKLPFTPSEAQKKLADAQKIYDSSLKASLPGSKQLEAANLSYEKLVSLQHSIQDSLESLKLSAQSSLNAASAALQEAKGKAAPDDASEISQIGKEVSAAESMLGEGAYADSLMASDRAVRAANVFLAARQSGALDFRALALGAVSLVFIAAAAWFFLSNKKEGKEKKEKKQLPREKEE